MRKYILLALLVSVSLIACNNSSNSANQQTNKPDSLATAGISYGEKIDAAGTIKMDSLLSLVSSGQTTINDIKVEGTIESVCQEKGCWMNIIKSDSSRLHVSFNEEFFIPKNSTGKTAIFMGTAYMDTTTVEALQHYAEDEGLSKAEIAKITEPEIRLSFDAKGVIIK